MKNSFVVKALVVLLVFVGLTTFAEAQDVSGLGRPDPTRQGRYLQYGKEMPHKGATVLPELPKGVNCGPAGEIVGIPLWNTTREGYAIVSTLTPKAEVAIVGDRTFLCHCAKGFNELFELEEQTETKPVQLSLTKTAERVVGPTGGNVYVTQTQTNALPPSETSRYSRGERDYNDKGGANWGKRILIGAVVVVGGILAYNHFHNRGPGVTTDGAKVKCTGTGYPNTCPTGMPNVGIGF